MCIRDSKQADLIRMAADRGSKLGKSQVSQYVSGKTLPRPLVRIEIQPYHGVIRLRFLRFLLDTEDVPIRIELGHAIAFRIVYIIFITSLLISVTA